MHPLVDAFIKGRGKFKKMIGRYYDSVDKPKKACNFGAAYYGVYGTFNHFSTEQFNKDFPELLKMVPIPCEHSYEHIDPRGEIGSLLIHLNDEHTGHTWNDKKVAEWLESALASTEQVQSSPTS